MTVLHVHYAIDYYSAVAVAWLAVRAAEKLSWLPDTMIWGFTAQERPQRMFKVCHKCGYSNESAAKFIDEQELAYQQKVYRGEA